jgi:hypothetical protein
MSSHEGIGVYTPIPTVLVVASFSITAVVMAMDAPTLI